MGKILDFYAHRENPRRMATFVWENQGKSKGTWGKSKDYHQKIIELSGDAIQIISDIITNQQSNMVTCQ